jgi:rhodanese-related sulfurtransferase
MLRGAEENQRYQLDADGIPRALGAATLLEAGEVEKVSADDGDIHRVSNALADRVSISIHVYGGNIGAVKRAVYTPEGQQTVYLRLLQPPFTQYLGFLPRTSRITTMSTYAYRQAAGIRQALLDRRELALIDVREEADFATAHPLFAVNLPLSKLELEVRRRIPRFTTPLTVYDNGEGLAEIAVERLRAGAIRMWPCWPGSRRLAPQRRRAVSGRQLRQQSLWRAGGKRASHAVAQRREVQALIDSRQEVVIVDARRFDEYQTMSIPGSISVPGGELALRVESLTPSPQTPVIVNCAGRTRSIIGTQSLINAGVPNPVHALRNGTIGWTLAGQTLAHQQQRQYDPSARASGVRAAEVAHLAERAGVAVIDEATLQRWLQQSDRTTFLFDVRSPEEYAAGHYPGSLSAPGGQLVQETDHFASVRGARCAAG